MVIQKSLTESAIEEMPENSASAKDELKKKNGNSSVIEEVKPPWNFTYKPLYPPTRKSVVVVESVTKAKVIKRYLGDMYEVLPSYGHVRDLAARSGSVRPDDDFSMVWEVPSPAWTHLKSIKVALSGYIFPSLTSTCYCFLQHWMVIVVILLVYVCVCVLVYNLLGANVGVSCSI